MRNDLKLISMEEVQAEEVQWLWYPYIPLGKLTIVQGDPGEGKTTFVLAVVAALTRGEALPESEQARAPMSVIYQTAEDGLADTIKPRLEASGVDCARVLVIDESKRGLTLCDDRLEQAVHRTGARLIVLDPIQAYLGDGVDMHRANEVRPVLKCVAAMAERTGCAVILIGHMNKAQGLKSGYRGLGSIDFRAAARSVLVEKTLWEERQLVTGWNCVARSAYDEMMTTKRQYGKTDGRTFYQFVQSFDPAEDVTPQEVHTIGLELAQKLFPEYEVVVAAHVDTDHLHNHLIVNSVSCETGRKLHQNAADLQRQRQINDEICMAHGLQMLEQPKKYVRDKKMRPGEYRSAVRGESWKLRLMNTVDLCMRSAKTRADFIREMERRGSGSSRSRWGCG